jgi:hypothetical protein
LSLDLYINKLFERDVRYNKICNAETKKNCRKTFFRKNSHTFEKYFDIQHFFKKTD